ncbi:glycosyl transferase family 28 [Corallococcus praedator]|uniref:Glycosyl transferase family 28 n=1 Tax=Corallococcus praedator TaxID=2316724 RepID=A0ABX9QS64_9BACT|nr:MULTISPECIES: glycosyltransferase [Corallococcus]RKH36556.1 glycosyl transferase family 28 [Corallococcus sp. CA031C]RKI17731.1 glycosyl transferase family 28 [Corallococcus praedator]
MATVGIYMLPEYGGLNATFALARTLGRRGHRVRYFVPDAFEAHVTRQGFESTRYSEKLRVASSWATRIPGVRFLHLRARYNEHLAAAFDAWVDADALDGVLVDPVVWNVAAGAHERGLPYLSLNPTYSAPFSLDYPSVHSSAIPPRGGASARARNLVAWTFQARIPWHRGLYDRSIGWAGHNAFRRVRRAGRRVRWGDFGYRPDVQELVIGPRALDFEPLRALPHRHYLGTSVEPSRHDGTFDWSGYDASRPLAYCSLGTFGDDQPAALRFLTAVIESFRRREGWQLIVSCGALAEQLRSQAMPPSIRVEASVPQLEVLPRARLFLNHGGIGSVREALYFGVPMLLFPYGADQPGLTARLVHHQLALRGDLRTKDARVITERVDALLARDDITQAMAAMKQGCRDSRELEEGADVIERHLASGPLDGARAAGAR